MLELPTRWRRAFWGARAAVLFARAVFLSCLLASSGAFAGAEFGNRLVNLSSRGYVGTGEDVMIAGFVISSGAPKQVLIRAAGPGLTQFGVAGVLGNPRLLLYDSNGLELVSNDDWGNLDPTGISRIGGQVGAFPFAASSPDSALLVTLSPGIYTAHVVGVGDGSGVALVEVYDVSGAPRMINLSTRAKVGTGASILIAGLVLSQDNGTRRILLRAAGPSLAQFGVNGVLADPVIAVYNAAGQQTTGNDNWGTGNDPAVLSAAFTQAGAFAFPSASRDAALLLDLAPGIYTLHVSGVGGTTGVALVEAYDLTPEVLPLVSVAATTPSTTTTTSAAPAVFTFTRTGNTSLPVAIQFTLSGTAVPGTDYDTVPTVVTIAAGASTAAVSIHAIAGSGAAGTNKDISLTIKPSSAYGLGSTATTSVSIFYEGGALFVAQLRPPANSASTASGTATIQMSPDGTYAIVNVGFSNLSSPQVNGYLRMGAAGTPVLRLPLGQASGVTWSFQGSSSFTAADLVAALRAGNIFVSIDSADFPGGEIQGACIRSGGSQQFSAPPAPPGLSLANPTSADAARFVVQATFGARLGDLAPLQQRGFDGWITDQIAKPASSHRTMTLADFNANNAGGQGGTSTTPNTQPGGIHRQAAWWRIAVSGEDQLRQRVAFALSELFVVSDGNDTINGTQEGLANYNDLLARDAFGNYRTLLEDVTLSPIMGVYLSHLRNAKADPKTGAQPDENYAREVMQLFTVGLNLLQPDGTLKLDAQGLPIPTYDQHTVTEMAKVFTGWGFPSASLTAFRSAPADYLKPMQLYPAYHDDTAKSLVNGVQLPAGQGGVQDLKDALDALFNHPNCGPFVGRQLIQRLVTSNPSPAYVYRVAQVFANNGQGVRGDLSAVIRAILLDFEARSPVVAANAGFGKLKEPLLRTTAVMRAAAATDSDGRFDIGYPEGSLLQAALRSPSVFNFFEPGYVQPGALAAAGLFAPEFQILTGTSAISVPNTVYSLIFSNVSGVTLGLTDQLALAQQPVPLVDRLNLLLCGGQMTDVARNRIVAAQQALPATTTDADRVRNALYLVTTTQAAAVQK